MSFNKIIIIGNLGRDPELRYTPQGNAVCSFTMATNEKRKDKSGESQDITTWFKVTLWGKQAENGAKYLKKSSAVYIEGRLRIEEWTDREGNNRFTLDVQATDMQFLPTANNGGGSDHHERTSHSEPTHSGPPPATSTPSSVPAPAADDDIPF